MLALDLEIILVDNGSTEEQPVPFPEVFSKIHYIKSEVNLGFAKGNNLGIDHASKPYILLLNSDTLITDPDTFVKCLAKLDEFHDKIVLTPRLLTATGLPQVTYGPLPGLYNEWMFSTFFYKLLATQQKQRRLFSFVPEANRLIEKGYITATFYMFPASMIRRLPEAKLYDETFLYGEELFWATQCIRAGYKMYYLAEVEIVHLVGRSSGALPEEKKRARRTRQISGEHDYLVWRYDILTVSLIYFLRIVRFSMLSIFDADIRLRLVLLVKLLFNKLK